MRAGHRIDWRTVLALALLMLGVAGAYGVTLAPDVTWANQGADSGDFVAAAWTGGVPHPSGYPTWGLLARLALVVPLGNPALRTNLLSLVAGVLAVGATAWLAARLTAGPRRLTLVAGLVAGLFFAFSGMFWAQAVITEVYTLHALFVALILLQMPLAGPADPDYWHWTSLVAGLVFGVALGNHLTTALLLPPWLLLAAFRVSDDGALTPGGRRFDFTWRRLALHGFGTVCGLSLYGLLWLWGRSGAPVNWGRPVDVESLWWVVSGQGYGRLLFALPESFLLPRIQSWARFLMAQFGLVGLVLALAGLYFGQARRVVAHWVLGYVVVVYSVFAVTYYTFDSNNYLITAYQALAVWLALGVGANLRWLAQRAPGWQAPAVALLAVVAFSVGARTMPTVDASRDDRALVFVQDVMRFAPEDALIWTDDDQGTFALWYGQYVLGYRPDVVIAHQTIASSERWYREVLADAYPALAVPVEAAGWPDTLSNANPDRRVCRADPAADVVLVCEDDE